MAAAVRAELAGSLGAAPYASEREAIWRAYWGALRELRRRWPALELADPRAAAPPRYEPPTVTPLLNVRELLAR